MNIFTELEEIKDLKKYIAIKWKSYSCDEINALHEEITKLLNLTQEIGEYILAKESIEKELSELYKEE